MNRNLLILIMLFCVFGLTDCQKKCGFGEIKGNVDIFLIKSYEKSGVDCQIDESSIILEDEVFISYEQILSYQEGEHIFKVDQEIIDKISNDKYNFHSRAIAIVADGELIYSCYFWASFSSMTCNWYTIDPIMIDYNHGLKVRMGYPGDMPGIIDPDRRDDARILNIFERDGKLK